MIAVVVYESIWGNTATLAKAIGQGLGMESRVMSTADASPAAIDGADLVVLGAPVHSYKRPEYAAIQAGREPDAVRMPEDGRETGVDRDPDAARVPEDGRETGAGREPDAARMLESELGAGDGAPSPGLVLMRDWIGQLPASGPPVAVFEIRIEGIPGEGGAKDVVDALAARGYTPIIPAETFRMERFPITPGPGGWITPEETDRARAWGVRLQAMVESG